MDDFSFLKKKKKTNGIDFIGQGITIENIVFRLYSLTSLSFYLFIYFVFFLPCIFKVLVLSSFNFLTLIVEQNERDP